MFGAHRSRGVAVSALVLAAAAAGCTHWKTQSVTPREVIAARHPERVRVSGADGRRVVLERPEIVGDTLYGAMRGRGPSARPAVALPDIETLAIRRFDPLGTAALTLGTAAVGAVAVIGAMWSDRAD